MICRLSLFDCCLVAFVKIVSSFTFVRAADVRVPSCRGTGGCWRWVLINATEDFNQSPFPWLKAVTALPRLFGEEDFGATPVEPTLPKDDDAAQSNR